MQSARLISYLKSDSDNVQDYPVRFLTTGVPIFCQKSVTDIGNTMSGIADIMGTAFSSGALKR